MLAVEEIILNWPLAAVICTAIVVGGITVLFRGWPWD